MFQTARAFGLSMVASILCLGMSSPASFAETAEAKAADRVIVAFGDSTTALRENVVVYATLLEQELASQGGSVKVVNAGVPSNTTDDAIKRFEKDVLDQKPNVVILQFGINDAAVNVWQDPPATTSRVAIKDYEKNLLQIVHTLKEKSVEVVLMTPNPCRWTNMLKELYGKPPYHTDDPDGFNVLLKDYVETVRTVAKQQNVPLIDVYAAFQAYGKEPGLSVDALLLDGMHPNTKGHELVAKLLLTSTAIGKKAD